ncbi:MAG: hypothetical protein OIF32_08800, partial [Campylobacterales bacterium]|nr:hypothetical protein [Campylobacterales bacterium]
RSTKVALFATQEAKKLKKPMPIPLGKPGTHTITHPVDIEEMKADGDLPKDHPSRFMSVIWDAVPPKFSFIETNTKREIHNVDRQFLNGSAQLKLVGKDRFSGTKTIYMVHNNQPKLGKNHGDLIENLTEGDHVFKFITVDNVGNVSKLYEKKLTIDKTPPTSQIKFFTKVKKEDGTLAVGPYSLISFKGQDNISGVKSINYKISKDFKSYGTKRVKLRSLKSGKHTVSYFAKDKVGNKESVKTVDFVMDKKAPITKMVFDGDVYNNNGVKYLSADTMVSLESRDFSGVARSTIALFDKNKVRYKDPVTVKTLMKKLKSSNLEGKITLRYFSSDRVGNLEKEKKKDLTIDLTPPKTGFKIKGDYLKVGELFYINEKTKLSLVAKDKLSGVKSIFYNIGESPENTYIKPLKGKDLPPETTVFYSAVDNVSNKSVRKHFEIAVDKDSPTVKKYFSFVGAKAQSTDPKETIYRSGTELYLSAKDNIVGVKNIKYSVNGKKLKTYKKSIVFKKPGNYKVKIIVKDKLNNTTTLTENFRIIRN